MPKVEITRQDLALIIDLLERKADELRFLELHGHEHRWPMAQGTHDAVGVDLLAKKLKEDMNRKDNS